MEITINHIESKEKHLKIAFWHHCSVQPVSTISVNIYIWSLTKYNKCFFFVFGNHSHKSAGIWRLQLPTRQSDCEWGEGGQHKPIAGEWLFSVGIYYNCYDSLKYNIWYHQLYFVFNGGQFSVFSLLNRGCRPIWPMEFYSLQRFGQDLLSCSSN